MGIVASCWQAVALDRSSNIEKEKYEGGPLKAMFQRIDKEGKGFVDLRNLEDLMNNDNSHFGRKGASDILEKYGTNGKMTMEQFTTWWYSSYTTYNDETLAQIVQETAPDETTIHTTPVVTRKFDLSTTRS
jgi:hypothetical protein